MLIEFNYIGGTQMICVVDRNDFFSLPNKKYVLSFI